ncbi:hypothetical protein HGRIS_014714 [Hohenbuehelia grisea]|uniref:Uncharacterized protein n=1 Tax=Hohenbuehelia grisea TaxID=104357 RepID=A0ABR3IQI0_9AGAR
MSATSAGSRPIPELVSPSNPLVPSKHGQQQFVLICDLADDQMDRLYATKLRPGAPDDLIPDDDSTVPNFCLLHGQYLCRHSHPSLRNAESKPELDHTDTVDLDLDLDDETPSPNTDTIRTNRVRFRSRVRIASGLNRHRTSLSFADGDHPAFIGGEGSLSSSPSSSISAPLRTPADDEDSTRPGWGPLGQRVSLFAGRGRARHRGGFASGDPHEREIEQQRDRERRERRRRRLGLPPLDVESCTSTYARVHGGGEEMGERAPLLVAPVARPGFVGGGGYGAVRSMRYDYDDDGYDSEGDGEDEARLSRQIDHIFGPMPGRLLNRHWWWWQLEPLITCHCSDDSDSES